MTCDVVFRGLVPVILFGLFFLRCESGSLQNHISLSRWKRHTCRPEEFSCSSHSCLAFHHVCDGKKDCESGSDETSQQCQNMRCEDDQFKCGYGACIRKYAVCDKRMDCADGSDESMEMCKTRPATSASYGETAPCVLPPQLQNGEYSVAGCDIQSCYGSPGTAVGSFAILNYVCHSGYELSGSSTVWCRNAIWSSLFPTCNRALCPPLTNPTRNFECHLRDSSVKCDEPMVPGTKAIVRCEPLYVSSPELSNYQITCSESGNWSSMVHSCIPECGLPNLSGLPFISQGRETKLAEFPWHIGIYQIFEESFLQKCGGSLIGPGVVITAAHCFWNENEGKLLNINSYRVTAGKYYREWQKRTHYFQEAEIEKVEIMRYFRGRKGLYAHDIAIVILKTNFVINEAVRPICLDLDEKFSEDFKPGTIGTVVGWGFTENKTQSDVLHAVMLPYENRNVCLEKTKESFIPFLQVHDKFCVGTTSGKSVCPGDSGGGFATKFKDARRYYLMGIVSAGVAPEGDNNCDIFQYSAFTKMSVHYSFISKYISL